MKTTRLVLDFKHEKVKHSLKPLYPARKFIPNSLFPGPLGLLEHKRWSNPNQWTTYEPGKLRNAVPSSHIYSW